MIDGTPVTFKPGAYGTYRGQFVKEVFGKALIDVHEPDEMIVLVPYDQIEEAA